MTSSPFSPTELRHTHQTLAPGSSLEKYVNWSGLGPVTPVTLLGLFWVVAMGLGSVPDPTIATHSGRDAQFRQYPFVEYYPPYDN